MVQPEGTGDCASHSTAARGNERLHPQVVQLEGRRAHSGADRMNEGLCIPEVVQPEVRGDSAPNSGDPKGKVEILNLLQSHRIGTYNPRCSLTEGRCILQYTETGKGDSAQC